ITDLISWRFLLEDLETALLQLGLGQAIHLPEKTTSVIAWSTRLQHEYQERKLDDQLDYWLSRTRNIRAKTRAKHPTGKSGLVSSSLDRSTAEKLTRELPSLGLKTRDALLFAAAEAVKRQFADAQTIVDVESTGRDPLFDDLDISRTAGWFTAMYPVLLQP